MATYAGVYSEHLQDRYGNGYRNALVAVQTLAAAPVTLYADRVKTAYVPASGLAANEIKADTKGNLRFFADPGNYQIVVTPSGGPTLAAFPISVLPDPLEPDASEGALAAEQEAREDADTTLTQAIADEASERANADTALSTSVAGKAPTDYVTVILPAPSGGDDAATLQAILDSAVVSPIRVIGRPKATYIARNLRLYSNTWLDLGSDVTLKYGGTNGTVAPLEGVPVVLYAEGTSGSPVTGLRITGGAIVGVQDGVNFTDIFTNQQDGIQLNHCHNALVEGVAIRRHIQDGIVLAESLGTKISSCHISDCNDGGIELRSGSSYKILNNRILRCGDGIPAKPDVTDVVISGNTITYFRNGGVLYPARRWRITHNDISATTSPDGLSGANGTGIGVGRHPALAATINTIEDIYIGGNYLAGATSSAVSEIGIDNSNGQTLARIVVQGNTLANCYRGIETDGASVIADNAIQAQRYGVTLIGSGNVVSANRIAVPATFGASVGVTVGSVDNTVTNNIVTLSGDLTGTPITCTADGNVISGNRVQYDGSTTFPSINVTGHRNLVSANRVSGTGSTTQGILIGGDFNVVTANVVSGHNHGIRLTGSADTNAVAGNVVNGAGFNGIQIQAGATKNAVTGNILLGNPTPLSDAGTSTASSNNVVA